MRINEWGAESYTFLLSDVIRHPSPPPSSLLHYITSKQAVRYVGTASHPSPPPSSLLHGTLVQQAVRYDRQLFCNIMNRLHWYNVKTSSALQQTTLLQYNLQPLKQQQMHYSETEVYRSDKA